MAPRRELRFEVGSGNLLLQPVSEQTVEAHEQRAQTRLRRAARIFECEHRLARPRRAIEEASRVVCEKIERVKLVLGEVEQALLGLFDLRPARDDRIKVRAKKLGQNRDIRTRRFFVGWRSVEEFPLFRSESFHCSWKPASSMLLDQWSGATPTRVTWP